MDTPGDDERPQILPYAKPAARRSRLGRLTFGLCVASASLFVWGVGARSDELVVYGMALCLAGAVSGAVALLSSRGNRGIEIACVALGVVVLIGGSLWVLTQRETHPPHAYCMSQLRQIGMAIGFYRADYADAPPPDLRTLVGTQMLSSNEDLLCPSANSGRPCDYFYHPPVPPASGPPSSSAPRIVVCDLKGNHPDGEMTVLFEDMHAEWFSAADFAKLLASPENAAFAGAWAKAAASRPTGNGQ